MDKISMDNSKLINNRVFLGRIFILAFLIALATIFDGLIASYRKPANSMDIITGNSMEIIGKVYGKVTTLNDISVLSDSSSLTIALDENMFYDYWLGEKMWRGELKTDSSLRPGRYDIKVKFHDVSMIKPDVREKVEKLSIYRVNVYGDAKALRQADRSLVKRHTGISPWSIAMAFFPVVLLTGGLIYLISSRLDTDMAQRGFAEIYRVSKHASGLEVFFGLGKTHGLEAGERINLYNKSGDLVSEIVVEKIGKETSSAVIDLLKIRPGCMVSRIQNHEVLCHY